MADGGVFGNCGSEQEKLGEIVRSQQKYGTATNTPCLPASPELFVKHFVQKDETLPGIALKYGRSVCPLRRFSLLGFILWAVRMLYDAKIVFLDHPPTLCNTI